MKIYPFPPDVDLEKFRKQPEELEAKYGLPRDVEFCRSCVISNQRPNSAVEYEHTKQTKKATIHFDENGICDACRVAEQKRIIDWEERDRELRDLCDRFRSKDGSYDCLVPGSGGKDSFYASHRDVGTAHLHGMGLEKFSGVDSRGVRQLPAHAERTRSPFADAPRRRKSFPSVPAVYHRAEGICAQDGCDAQYPAGVLRRERSRVR
jgi:hypothetical protein